MLPFLWPSKSARVSFGTPIALSLRPFDELVASLLPLMEKLTTGRAASLLSPDVENLADWRPVFDWASVINLGGIVYVGLDSLSDVFCREGRRSMNARDSWLTQGSVGKAV